MEEEAALFYREYKAGLSAGQAPKPVVGFVAGRETERGKMYGHAGAVWWDESETAQAKIGCFRDAGIQVARTLSEVGRLLMEAKTTLDTEGARPEAQ